MKRFAANLFSVNVFFRLHLCSRGRQSRLLVGVGRLLLGYSHVFGIHFPFEVGH